MGGGQQKRQQKPTTRTKMMLLGRPYLAAALATVPSVALCSGGTRGGTKGDTPKISSTTCKQKLPTVVLVHGLDSSKQTWSTVQGELCRRGYPQLAIDQRGHGESELGDPSKFSAEALARDVIRSVEIEHGVERPWILVGHSMGGRVAIRVAAIAALEAPDMLGACVIEDIDCRALPGGDDVDGAAFDRTFDSWPAARTELVKRGYDAERVDSWLGQRVRQFPDGSWHSDINPQARSLAWKTVLAADDADRAWDLLTAHSPLPFPVHLWVAGDAGTVVRHDGRSGIHNMLARLPEVAYLKFDRAAHSIHNTDRDAFLNALIDVILKVAASTKS